MDVVLALNVSESFVSQALNPQYATQKAGERRPFSLDASEASVPVWQSLVSVVANSFIRPTEDNATGFVYKTSADGQTGSDEPAWALSGVTQDGSLQWTALAPAAAGQDTIASATWDQESPPDAALTITGVTNTALSTNAMIGGGTQGETYLVVVSITMTSGPIYKQPIYVNVV
jgi:hypothetical protein